MAQYFCDAVTVPASAADVAYALDSQVRLFQHAGVFVHLDVGAGMGESVSLRVEFSDDGTTWYRVDVYDPTGNAYAAGLTFTAGTQELEARLDSYAPYVRLIANNAGATAATLTAFLIRQ